MAATAVYTRTAAADWAQVYASPKKFNAVRKAKGLAADGTEVQAMDVVTGEVVWTNVEPAAEVAPVEDTPEELALVGDVEDVFVSFVLPAGEFADEMTGTAAWDVTERPARRRGTVAGQNADGAPRLKAGALGGLVEDYLRENDGDASATQVGKALARSVGAVQNALERLVAAGTAVRTQDKPRRYTLAA